MKYILRSVSVLTILVIIFTGVFSCSPYSYDKDVVTQTNSPKPTTGDPDDSKVTQPGDGDTDQESNSKITVTLDYARPFSDGVAWLSYNIYNEDTFMNKRIAVAVDTQGNVLFELPEGVVASSEELFYRNGIMVIGNTVYDKQLNVVASPDKSGYQKILFRTDDYIIVYKREESFQGDKQYVGVLDTNGQWVHTLSTDNPIAKEIGTKRSAGDGNIIDLMSLYINEMDKNCITIEAYVLEDGGGAFKHYTYDIAANKLYDFGQDWIPEKVSEYHYCQDGGSKDSCGIFKFNVDGTKTFLVNCHYDTATEHKHVSVAEIYDSSFLCYTEVRDEQYDIVGEYYTLHDNTGRELARYDEYEIVDVLAHYNDNLFCIIKNPTGSEYLVLFDENGNTRFEPIKNDNYIYKCLYGDENGFLLSSGSKVYFYYCNGSVKEFDARIEVDGYDPESNIALINNGWGTYLYVTASGETVFDPHKIELNK